MRSFILAVLVAGCSSSHPTEFFDRYTQVPSAVPDAGIHSAPVEAGTVPQEEPDAGYTPYDPCVNYIRTPTIYPRLFLQGCTDSNGLTNQVGYWDSELGIICTWKRAMDDRHHCLPLNEQSSFFYSDDQCLSALAFIKAGTFYAPYVGLTIFKPNNIQSVQVFAVGANWLGDDQMHYRPMVDGRWACLETETVILGATLIYVGGEVDPNVFVKQ